MDRVIRIGTRESQLAMWQANLVKSQLEANGVQCSLVTIHSEGDINLKTPLYEIGVQGIFTRALDIALLNNEIDVAVHSMKDVPTVMAKGIVQAAVLPRASYKDVLVPRTDASFLDTDAPAIIATSSIRRKAQWLNRYPHHRLDNLRGNVNTRLRKVQESNWAGAIFAAAGLERIGLRPESALDLDWMLPAPAQGAIVVVCRGEDSAVVEGCKPLHDADTALCVGMERDFLRALLGGCSTPISALAEMQGDCVIFKGNILSTDGRLKQEVAGATAKENARTMGVAMAIKLLEEGGQQILDTLRK